MTFFTSFFTSSVYVFSWFCYVLVHKTRRLRRLLYFQGRYFYLYHEFNDNIYATSLCYKLCVEETDFQCLGFYEVGYHNHCYEKDDNLLSAGAYTYFATLSDVTYYEFYEEGKHT